MNHGRAVAINDQEFEKEVLKASGVSLVDFWAEWCGPCKVLSPTLESVAEQYAGQVQVFKIDVDANPSVASQFRIRGLPTVLVFKDGQLVDQLVGTQPKEALVRVIEKHRAS